MTRVEWIRYSCTMPDNSIITRLRQRIAALEDAMAIIESGRVSSTSWEGRTITHINLTEMRERWALLNRQLRTAIYRQYRVPGMPTNFARMSITNDPEGATAAQGGTPGEGASPAEVEELIDARVPDPQNEATGRILEAVSGSPTLRYRDAPTEGGGGTNPRDAGDGLELDGNDLKAKAGDASVVVDSSGIKVANPFTSDDETKLDGIQAGAQVNPPRAGAFTAADEAKLDGIQAGAQVNPDRAGAFTQADEAKLDGIDNGAQVNPKHIVSFRTLDNNGALQGTTFFIKSDNTEWNSGGTDDIAAVEIDSQQLTLSQNPQLDNGSYTAWHSLAEDLVVNGGRSAWAFYNMGSTTNVPAEPTFILHAGDVIKNGNGNYVLQDITVLKDWTWTGSNGVNWQVKALDYITLESLEKLARDSVASALRGVPVSRSGENILLGAQSIIWGGQFHNTTGAVDTLPSNGYILLSASDDKLTATPSKGDYVKLRLAVGAFQNLIEPIKNTHINGDILIEQSGGNGELHLSVSALPSGGGNGAYYDILGYVHHVHAPLDNTSNVTVRVNPNYEFISASRLFGLSDQAFNEALLSNLPDYAVAADSGGVYLVVDGGTIKKYTANLITEEDIGDLSLGSYIREASNSSLGAGQYWYNGSNEIQLVPAGGKEGAVADASVVGTVVRIGTALATITATSTIGATRRVWTVAVEGDIPATGQTSEFINRGDYVTYSDLAKVARTGRASDLVDISDYVTREELAGRETDRYASYNNAFIGSGYRSGDWVLSTDTAGPPTTPNLVRQPDIATGSGVVALGRLRTDADPNTLVWAPVPTANDYSNGDVIYASLDRDKGSHLKITLTSDMTLVGTGDAAYIWATASWVEVGDIANVTVAGDYFKLAEYAPSNLQIEIPASDILGLLDYIRGKVGPAADPIDGTTKLMLADLTGLSIDHLERHFADRFKSFGNFNIVTSSQYDAKGEIDAGQLTNANKKIRISLADGLVSDFDEDVTANMLVELYEDSSNYILARVTSRTNDSLRTAINGRYVNLATLEGVGSVGVGDTVEFRLYVQGDGLVPVPESEDTGKVLRATGVNAYDWGEESSAGNYVFFGDDAAVGGTGNAITVTASPTADAYREGMQVIFEPTANNSASATINVDGLGAKTIVREDGTTLESGDIINDRFAHVVYDGVFFILLNRHMPAPPQLGLLHEATNVVGEATNQWTSLGNGYGNDQILHISGWETAGTSRLNQSATLVFEDIPQATGSGNTGPRIWLAPAGDGGRRVQIRRGQNDATALECSRAGAWNSSNKVKVWGIA